MKELEVKLKDNMATRLHQVRMALDLTQQEFAKQLGLLQPKLSDLESGKRQPSLDVVIRLCKMGVDMKWFLTGNASDELITDSARSIDTLSLAELKSIQIQHMLKGLDVEELLVLEGMLNLIHKQKVS